MIAKNVYGFTLNYYNNDYTGIGAGSPSAGIPSQLGSDNKQLFNGNISSMGVNIPRLGNSILYNFQYDQLNRLVAMDAWNSTNSTWGSLNKIDDYQERLTYDANGNILNYLRNGTGGALNLNNYTYSYTAETNRLASITNSVNSSTGTYGYDAIGNVTKDDKQNVSEAEWNVYGKLQNVLKAGGLQINYTYNPRGNRSLKVVGDTTEAYVRDASGNIMSVYKKIGSEPLKQSELNIYGSAMIGTVGEHTVLSDTVVLPGGFAGGISKTFTRGEKEYLLTDHRGNNMVSITDRRQQYSTAGNTVDYYVADIRTASYYSSFGAISNSYNSSLIKYGFNGQRRSTEISGTAQTAEFWEYNGDVGRRWNVDPIVKSYESPYSTFGNNPILHIDPFGADTSLYLKRSGVKIGSKSGGDKTPIYVVDELYANNKSYNMDELWALATPLLYEVGKKTKFKGITGNTFRDNHPLKNIGTKFGSQVFEEDLLDLTDEFQEIVLNAIPEFIELNKLDHKEFDLNSPKASAFRKLVTDDAKYDLKSKKTDDGTPSYAAIVIGEWSLLNGTLRRYDDYGNISYGVFGLAAGLTRLELTNGSELNQQLKDLNPFSRTKGGDEQRDKDMLEAGYFNYNGYMRAFEKSRQNK